MTKEFLTHLLLALGHDKLEVAMKELNITGMITDAERADSLKVAYEELMKSSKWAPCLRQVPNFVIIGAMKCGTTSLYDYICQHPKVIRARQKEPHVFDWKWERIQKLRLSNDVVKKHREVLSLQQKAIGSESTESPTPPTLQLKYLLAFDVEQLNKNADSITGEATPSYLLGGAKVARRLLYAAGHKVKLIVTLRDPTLRAFSHFNMTCDMSGTEAQRKARGHVAGKSFEELVSTDLKELEKINVSPAMNAKVFEDEYLSKLPQGHGSHSYVGRGLYALQLKRWFTVYPRSSFHFVFLDNMSKEDELHEEMKGVFSFLRIPDSYQVEDTKRKNARKYKRMPQDMEEKLRKFYAPYNRELEKLLGCDLSHWTSK